MIKNKQVGWNTHCISHVVWKRWGFPIASPPAFCSIQLDVAASYKRKRKKRCFIYYFHTLISLYVPSILEQCVSLGVFAPCALSPALLRRRRRQRLVLVPLPAVPPGRGKAMATSSRFVTAGPGSAPRARGRVPSGAGTRAGASRCTWSSAASVRGPLAFLQFGVGRCFVYRSTKRLFLGPLAKAAS